MKVSILLTVFLMLLFSCRKVNKDCNISEYSDAPDKDWFTSHGGTSEDIIITHDGAAVVPVYNAFFGFLKTASL